MDEISTQLQAAVAEPPPTRIDLDGLIRAEGRRRRQRARVWSGTGLAAAVAAVLVTPNLVAGGPAPGPVAAPPASATAATTGPTVALCTGVSPSPSGPQPPLQSYGTVRERPTESPAAGAARLTGVLRSTLRTGLPAGVRVESVQPGCAEPQFQYHPSYREYDVSARLRHGTDTGLFVLRVMPTARSEARADCTQAPDQEHCTVVRYPDGTASVRSVLGSDGQQLSVQVVRPDGTSVMAITTNFRYGPGGRDTVTASAPLLTLDQLDALARTPALTLYP